MKNLIFKTSAALLTIAALTTQIVAAPSSKTSQMQMPQTKPLPFDLIPARGGIIKITPIIHASIQIEYRGKVILVDPISAGSYRKKADLILITHMHSDHYDRGAILKNSKVVAPIVFPAGLSANISTGKLSSSLAEINSIRTRGTQILSNYTTQKIGVNSSYTSFPMYNIVRGPKPGQKYHPKGVGNGYILTLGGKRIYIAGDTEATPEMKALKNIDAAFIPMNLPYTMTPQEAAVGVRAFKPKIVYPYHFRYPFNQPNTNPQQFIQAMKGSGVSVRVLDWYNAAPVARFMAANATKK